MCTTKLYQSRICGHMWLAIDVPCNAGKGFSNCSTFRNTYLKRSLRGKAFFGDNNCPWHDREGSYDFNEVRIITRKKSGWIAGPYPNRDGAIEHTFCFCTVM